MKRLLLTLGLILSVNVWSEEITEREVDLICDGTNVMICAADNKPCTTYSDADVINSGLNPMGSVSVSFTVYSLDEINLYSATWGSIETEEVLEAGNQLLATIDSSGFGDGWEGSETVFDLDKITLAYERTVRNKETKEISTKWFYQCKEAPKSPFD
ncbi:hypothetical protein OAP13_04165 [Gammaproteobacteria bacterium]|nr:hypothetical protein [Gammaproteobacteria bacterium]